MKSYTKPSTIKCFRSYTRWDQKFEKNKKKLLIFKRILFKKVAIMHGMDKFSKIEESICNIPVETSNISNFLPRP